MSNLGGKYATNTKVSEERSREEIDKALKKYGATKRVYGFDDDNNLAGLCHGFTQFLRNLVGFPNKHTGLLRSSKKGKSHLRQRVTGTGGSIVRLQRGFVGTPKYQASWFESIARGGVRWIFGH